MSTFEWSWCQTEKNRVCSLPSKTHTHTHTLVTVDIIPGDSGLSGPLTQLHLIIRAQQAYLWPVSFILINRDIYIYTHTFTHWYTCHCPKNCSKCVFRVLYVCVCESVLNLHSPTVCLMGKSCHHWPWHAPSAGKGKLLLLTIERAGPY